MEFNKNILIIDSSKRLNGTSTSFVINFDNNVCVKKYIKLSHVLIPNTTYNINSSQFITFTLVNNTSFVINMIDGNYNSSDLITLLNSLFQSNVAPINASYNKNTYKISFTMTGANFLKQMIFSDNNLKSLFGFTNLNYNNLNVASITGENIIKLNSSNLIFISLDKIGVNNFVSNNNINSDFIIPCLSDSGSYIVYDYHSHLESCNIIKGNEINFKMLNVVIKNDNNNVFNNNNGDVTLVFEYV